MSPLDRWKMAIGADVRGPAKAVFLILTYHADSKFFDCRLWHETLARESGFSVKTVKRAIAHLIDLGLVATYSRGFKAALRYEIFPHRDRSERPTEPGIRTRFKRTRCERDTRRTYKGRFSEAEPGPFREATRSHRIAGE